MNILRNFRLLSKQVHHIRITSMKYAAHPTKFVEMEDRWREKDGVPKGWNLIYKAPLDSTLNYLTSYLTVTSGIIALGGIYYGLTIDFTDTENPILLNNEIVIATSPVEGLIYFFAFIAFHASLKILISRFVIRLYQNDDNYTAVFRSNFYNKIKKHEFHLKDFERLKPPFFVSWGDSRFSLGNKKAILLEDYFKSPEYINYLLYKRKLNKQ